MKIGILGSGTVAQTIGGKLVALGHEVTLGTRDPSKLAEWQSNAGSRVGVGSFAEAAGAGDIVFNCTAGTASLEALQLAGEGNLNGKILVDVANALDFSGGMPPILSVINTDSLGEQIQRAYPAAKVVKALNTMTTRVMVEPSLVPGEHDVFICGNDAGAKATVTTLLTEGFGWKSAIDLGDITGARGMEQLLPIWIRLMGTLGTPLFNFHIAK